MQVEEKVERPDGASGLGGAMQAEEKVERPDGASVLKVVAPQDGGWSLTPMENLLRGLRNVRDLVALELFGSGGVVAYNVRTTNVSGMGGVLHSYFPQARVELLGRKGGEQREKDDWLYVSEDERAMVQPLALARESYLPLRIFDDGTIEQSKMDPLAGVIGLLASSTRSGGEMEGERLGVRLVLKPAAGNWNSPWQDRMQKRRDGEDRAQRMAAGGQSADAPGMGTIMLLGSVGSLAFGNWWLWDQGNTTGMLFFNLAAALAGVAGVSFWRRYGAEKRRPYLDEELVEAKLKALAFWTEVQIVRVYSKETETSVARESMESLLDCLRSFDDPAGNSWKPGQVREYNGQAMTGGVRNDPFVGGGQMLGWVDPRRAERTALSAREVASLWHPPLGADEMASMERTSSGVLVPYLADLSLDGEDAGPLVGVSEELGQDIRLPESALRKHSVFFGAVGSGKVDDDQACAGPQAEAEGGGEG